MQIAGALILGLVVIQLGLFVFSTLQQMRGAERQRQAEQDLLRRRIDAATALQQKNEQLQLTWNGYRKIVVDRIDDEADHVRSFYLVPHDRKPLPRFQTGQYLTFRLKIPGQPKPIVKCYSLSDCPRPDYYRVTIKRALPPPDSPDAPPGIASSYFHDHVRPGDILDVQTPRGHFTLDPTDTRPAVLIAGGVGITPLLCMALGVAEADTNREIDLFYGVRHGGEHAMKQALETLSQQNDNIRVTTAYSHPREEDARERDYQIRGHITVDTLKEVLGSNAYQFYICGPPPMMSALRESLEEWGVPATEILKEMFGNSSVKQVCPKPPSDGQSGDETKPAKTCKVTLGRSGRDIPWDGSCTNLLDFLHKNEIDVDEGCRAGNCGSCVVAVKSGHFAYLTEPGAEQEDGSCFTCIAVPQDDLTLDV